MTATSTCNIVPHFWSRDPLCDLARESLPVEKKSLLTSKPRLSPPLTASERRGEAGDGLSAVMSEHNVNTSTGRICDFDR